MKRTTRRAVTAVTSLAVVGVVAGAGSLSSGVSSAPSTEPVAHVVPVAVHESTEVLEARTERRNTFAARASRDAARKAARAKALKAKKAKARAKARERAERQARRSAASAAATTPTYATGSPREIGRQLAAARGWTGAQWDALDRLWTAESGWSTTAGNGSTGAYGIPQALPGSKMASAGGDWRTSARTQIQWGLGYIATRWGTPINAYGNFQRARWY